MKSRESHKVLFWAPSDLAEARDAARKAVESANRATGASYRFVPLEEVPQEGEVQARLGAASVVVLAFKARFDPASEAFADFALAQGAENQRPRVRIYVSDKREISGDEALEEVTRLFAFKKRVGNIRSYSSSAKATSSTPSSVCTNQWAPVNQPSSCSTSWDSLHRRERYYARRPWIPGHLCRTVGDIGSVGHPLPE